jgi:hypothetical protein
MHLVLDTASNSINPCDEVRLEFPSKSGRKMQRPMNVYVLSVGERCDGLLVSDVLKSKRSCRVDATARRPFIEMVTTQTPKNLHGFQLVARSAREVQCNVGIDWQPYTLCLSESMVQRLRGLLTYREAALLWFITEIVPTGGNRY